MEKETILERIVIDPNICHGKPCIRGMRYPVGAILEYLAGGDRIADIQACHSFASFKNEAIHTFDKN